MTCVMFAANLYKEIQALLVPIKKLFFSTIHA
jgi:hypothetical protein